MRRAVLAVAAAIGIGCSSPGARPADAGAVGQPEGGIDDGVSSEDGASDGGPPNTTACRVPLDDALNPCAPTVAAQSARQQGTDFGVQNICTSTYSVFTSYQQDDHTWQCVYGPGGTLIGWDRIESGQRFCEGRASAAVGDAYSRYQLIDCLEVDNFLWTWIQSFDPGPPTISIQIEQGTIVVSKTMSLGFSFTLGGQDIAASDLTLRYWYTADAGAGSSPMESTSCSGANGLVCDDFAVALVPVTPARPMADTYAEISFPTFPGIISTGFPFSLGFSITRGDGALSDQSNDYSYGGPGALAPTTKVTAYVRGALIYGTEP